MGIEIFVIFNLIVVCVVIGAWCVKRSVLKL